MSKKLVLIDGNSIIYRAFYALPLLNNDKGVYTNAVYGFTTMLLRILEEEKPSHILVAYDAGKTTFRHATYSDYKGGRQKTPPELSEQFPLTKELLEAFHIKHYELDLYEADDIIGTLSEIGQEENMEVKIISGDQDLLQLVSKNVTVDLTKKGISEVESYTPTYLENKMEIKPSQVIDLKGLMGDNSDNIPGVPGVGIKTATKLLKQYNTIDNLYQHIEDITAKKLKENLLTYKNDAYMSKELVTINRQSPIDIDLKSLIYNGYKDDTVKILFNELGFQSILNRLGIESSSNKVEMKDFDYELVSNITEKMLMDDTAMVVETLGDNYHETPIEGISIINQSGQYFIPVETALSSRAFKDWAEDETKTKSVFDAKKTLVVLLRHDIHIKGITFDLLLAAYLLNPAEKHDDIPSIALRMNFNEVEHDEVVYGKGAKLKIPEIEVLSEHIARKANALYQLQEKFLTQLEAHNLMTLYKNLEMPLALILGEMEHTGVQVDIARLEQMRVELKGRLEEIEKDIFAITGETFNVNSPKQLGVILFEKLSLPVIKKTKTGYSTAADVLEKLVNEHEIIPKIMLYRQLGKLQSTYIEGLLKVVHKDSQKIHTRFNQALTQTGRLSSIEPNLQNIPIRLKEGRKIRQAFIPSHPDWVIFSADYSQIELRVLAHIAQDDKLIDAFNHNLDIHTQTAADVFHVDRKNVTDGMRSQAKSVNFGIVYGMSDYGLSQNLGITRKEAKKFIERYFTSYPGVATYMKEIVQEAKHKGFVTTIMNRRRYLPEITSRNFNQRSFAERTAMNSPIQGSAADIIKKAMIDLHAALKKENMQAQVLLQVHDELILEAPKTEIKKLEKLVPDMMEKTVDLTVPLKVDYTYGDSWFDAN